jgi:hypothetical protein
MFFGMLRGDLGPEYHAKAEAANREGIHLELRNDGLQNEGWFYRDPEVWRKRIGDPDTKLPPCGLSFTYHTEAEFLSGIGFLVHMGYHGGCLLEPLD